MNLPREITALHQWSVSRINMYNTLNKQSLIPVINMSLPFMVISRLKLSKKNICINTLFCPNNKNNEQSPLRYKKN